MSLTFEGRFADRVGLVTGAAGGIGEAVARRFAAEGGRVVIVDRNGEGADRVAAEINDGGGQALAYQADVASAADVERVVESVVAAWERIDVLVNNAGIAPRPTKPFLEMVEEDYRSIMEVNLWGVFLCTRTIAPCMVAHGYGRIVHVGSRSYLGQPDLAVYAASKSALIGFTNSLALELGPYGITVNIVAPGSTMTPLRQSDPDHIAGAERLIPTVPVRRHGRSEDQAAAILFLASEEAGYISSELLLVSGGRRSPSTYESKYNPTAS